VLASGECEVWWARPDAVPQALITVLDDAEQGRYQRFRHRADAERYLAARALTRIVLSDTLGVAPTEVKLAATCRVCGGAHGKPTVVGEPGIELSLAHSGSRVAVAVSTAGAVGVDVERLRPVANVEALASRVLSPAERPELAALPIAERAAALLTYWTRKEALLKATGDGLSVPMSELTVSPPDQRPRLLAWSNRRAPQLPAWLHALDPGTGHVAHLALLAEVAPGVAERDGDPLLASGPPR
jgi:4'-phosphopantetheinyl transferase